MSSRILVIMLLIAATLVPPADAQARDDIKTIKIEIPEGQSTSIVNGRIKGYETVDYLVEATAGQTLNISLGTTHTAAYFNLLAPGETAVAFFIGSMQENQFEGAVADEGIYTIRIYMLRSAARREEVADYRLEIINAGAQAEQATSPHHESHDALVPGTNHHAVGTVPCTMAPENPAAYCSFNVTRDGPGNALVTIIKPDGRQRVIFFDQDKAIGYDFSQADPGDFSTEESGDTHIVHIGSERYEIPDAVINGG